MAPDDVMHETGSTQHIARHQRMTELQQQITRPEHVFVKGVRFLRYANGQTLIATLRKVNIGTRPDPLVKATHR